MDQETEKIIADQMKKLPKDIVAAIVSVDYKTKLQEITKRQRLLIDQAGKLEMETTLVMIGLEPLADYVANLERELGVPVMQAKQIAGDVSEHIFKPIRESLQAMNQAVEDEEIEREQNRILGQGEIPKVAVPTTTDDNLDRDQILNEIEDPSLIEGEKKREIETLDETPYQQDIKVETPVEKVEKKEEAPKPNIFETKMAGMTITSQQIVDATPEIKLPAIEKKRPSGGVDPYREEIK
jgi:restriction endonuclease